MDTENRWQNRVISYCHFRRIIHFAESLKLFISCPVAKVTNVYRCKYDNFILIWGQIVGDWKKMAEIIAFRDKTSFAKTCQFTNCRKLPFLKLSSISIDWNSPGSDFLNNMFQYFENYMAKLTYWYYL